jgi:calcium/calmodulin-dependent protein kinase I
LAGFVTLDVTAPRIGVRDRGKAFVKFMAAGEAVISSAIPTAITAEYDIGDTIGTGHFSKVKIGVHKQSGEMVAIKIIQKPTNNKIAMLKAEVDILTRCDHPNVVKMHACYETEKVLYLVLELLTGGELFDCIIAKGHYSEADARNVTITLLDAIKYLHSRGVAHRDLKPENILLKDSSNAAAVKITDFGLSKIFADDLAGEVIMKTACGTPGYVAPEVLTSKSYSSQVDLWSVGVIVYVLLCGFPPFYGENDAQMFKKIKAGSYKFLSPYWDPISADAKDFVSKLLVVDPTKRMTAAEALDHRWLGRTSSVSTKNLFDKEVPADEQEAAGDAGLSQAEDGAELSGAPSGLREALMHFNLDRKLVPAKLIKCFDLPENSASVGKFACSLGSAIGQLHVTTYHLCFLGALGRKLLVPLADIVSVVRAKRFKLMPGAGRSLHVTARSAVSDFVPSLTHEFNGFSERGKALNTILKACEASLGTVPTVG